MILLAHPTGNTFFRAAARAFHAQGWLQELDSSICWDRSSQLARVMPPPILQQLNRRAFTDVPLTLQHSYPRRELIRLAAGAFQLSWLQRHEYGALSIDAVYRSFDRHVASRLSSLPGLQAVYAYEDGALRTFEAARGLGLRCIYDLPIGYWRAAQQIFAEERELQPAWASTLTGLADSAEKLARKDRELELADAVLVPSHFVRSTLQSQSTCSAPIYVVPFGSPMPHPEPPQPLAPSMPLRVLYVGSLGQRKGLGYALDAIAELGSRVSLTLIGRPTSLDCVPLRAALERHRWIPTLPHPQILEQMRQHDVLLLPSLFEGFALVISEALSQGLPVIATPNSGATESVRDGTEGFIVPIRDSQAIAERLHQLATDKDLLVAMRLACLRRAQEQSWARYEEGLQAAVAHTLAAQAYWP
jgi:starch synthase